MAIWFVHVNAGMDKSVGPEGRERVEGAGCVGVVRCANRRCVGSGRRKSSLCILKIAGDEVVLLHRRTLSLSGYLMLGWKVVDTLSDEADSKSEAIRETGQIIEPTLAL